MIEYPNSETRVPTWKLTIKVTGACEMLRRAASRLLVESRSYQGSASSSHRSSSISILAYPSLYRFTARRTMASLAAERYLADKAPPICRVEIAKSFSQLTSVALFHSRQCPDGKIAKRRSCMRTMSVRRHGQGLASFKASGHHKRPASMIS